MNKHNWVYRNTINTLLDYDISNAGTYLCCRKLVWKFIRFFWNPLPLLQTPENLENKKRVWHHWFFLKAEAMIKSTNNLRCIGTRQTDRQTEGQIDNCQLSKNLLGGGNYKPIQRRRSSNHERCPKECWVSAGDPKTQHELCFHKLVQRLKNHPALSQPEPQFVVSYKKRKQLGQLF